MKQVSIAALLVIPLTFYVASLSNKPSNLERIKPNKTEETPSEYHRLPDSISPVLTLAQSQFTQSQPVQNALGQLIEGKKNAFFDRTQFVEEWITKNPTGLSLLLEYLNNDSEIKNIHLKKSFQADKPRIVLERMAAIDLISDIANQDSYIDTSKKAKELLATFVEQEVKLDSPEVVRKVFLAEKFDALVALTEVDPALARQIFNRIEKPAIRNMLGEAVLIGLIGSGMSHQDAVTYLTSI